MNLPKQSQPIPRDVIELQSYLNESSIRAASIEDCYRLTGAARQLCLAMAEA
jgi:hypothetical protein